MGWKQNALSYRTPYYVYDLDIVRETVSAEAEILGLSVGLCYAMKANPFLVSCVSGLVDRVEICSMGEYRICRKLNVPPEKMFISGVLKEEEDIREILHDTRGRSSYTVESPGQYAVIAGWAAENRTEVGIFPRLTSGNQFGMDRDNVLRILKLAADNPYVKAKGIHFFSGTQKRNAKQMTEELAMLDQLCAEEPLAGALPEIEYGPGLPVNYYVPDSVQRSRGMLAEVAEAIKGMSFKGHVTVEMGRGIAAECGFYVTKVRDIKKNGNLHVCIVDGGIHQLKYDGQMLGMKHPRTDVIKADASCGAAEGPAGKNDPGCGDSAEWDVFGSLCTVQDVLLKNCPLGPLSAGDLIVFEQAGAYSSMEGISFLLSHDLPAVYGYDEENGMRRLRERTELWSFNS